MRTFEEIYAAAITLRRQLLREGKDPAGVFHITADEKMTLWNRAPFFQPSMDPERRTFCGLTLKIIDTRSEHS